MIAEDTRHTRVLLDRHGVRARLRSFHAHSRDDAVDAFVAEARAGARLALVTDAGTPVISDPGVRLVAAVRDAGIRVEAVPGPSAVTAAIAVAGLRADVFRFVGFLPRSGGRRRRVLDEIARERGATVLFEAPGRVGETLADLARVVGPARRAAVCRELTKIHEEVVRAPIGELAERFHEGARGEVTVVVEAADDHETVADVDEDALAERAAALLEDGLGAKDAAAALAEEAGISRRAAYAIVLAARGRR